MQAGVAFLGESVNPPFDSFARHAHCCSDVGLRPSAGVALDDETTAMDGQSGITVGHENLRMGVGLRQATSHSEVLVWSTRLAVANLLAGYSEYASDRLAESNN